MDDLQDQIRAWTDAVSLDAEPVTAEEARARAEVVRQPRRIDRPGRRAVLVGAAAALVVVALVVVAGVDRGQDVTTGGPGASDDATTDVAFEVLMTGGGPEVPGTMRSAFSSEGLDSLWTAAGFEGPAPVVDFDARMVVSMTILDRGCGSDLRRFDLAGVDLTPVFGSDGRCPEEPETFMVSLDRGDTDGPFRLVLLSDRHGGPADRILDLAPPLPSSQQRPTVWPNQATIADRSSPEAAARSFITHLLGAEGSGATVDAASSGASPVSVEVGFEKVAVMLQTDESDQGWAVTRAGDAEIALPSDLDASLVAPASTAAVIEMWVETDLGGTATSTVVSDPQDTDLAFPPGTIRSIVIVQRNQDGTILALTGQGF
jgi:hypothetical protein